MFAIGTYLTDPETGKRAIIEAVGKNYVLCKIERRRPGNKQDYERQNARRAQAYEKA
jgi:hypothetical protein